MAEPILPGLSEDEAQSRFDELIDRAERGEAFIITRNGRPVAKLSPPNRGAARQSALPRRKVLYEPASYTLHAAHSIRASAAFSALHHGAAR